MGFFKAYDMRGTFGADFDLDTVFRVGRALPDVLAAANAASSAAPRPAGRMRVLVGRDARATSEAVRDALVAGLVDAGAEVVDLGPATTPMTYFFTAEEDFDGSVMITASHNPPGDNGLKVSRRGAVPVGYESGLAEVERRVAADATPRPAALPVGAPVRAPEPARLDAYVRWLRENGLSHAGLRFAVDCSDGMASLVAHGLFPDAVFLNDVPDGAFPHHAPNPLLAEARAQVAEVVRARGLDCGVIFDGDADRAMFVDENGDFIQPDYLIPVLASTFDEVRRAKKPLVPGAPEGNQKAPVVIHDVRTSRAATAALRELGCLPCMGKVGHAYAKNLLRTSGAVCGGELAGHYYFRDFHFCDSGELAALRILAAFAEAKARGRTVSAFLAPVTRRLANTGELNFRVAEKDAAIARALKAAEAFGPETGRETMDGWRLDYAAGWVSIRKSNTEPYLRLIVECDTPERRDAWTRALTAAIGG